MKLVSQVGNHKFVNFIPTLKLLFKFKEYFLPHIKGN